ncbi:MAG TPA: hypothetical protein VIK74_09360 [Parasegetibacter sp.]
MKPKYSYLIAAALLVFASCQKELSSEDMEIDGPPPPPDSNCFIDRVSQIDTTAGVSVGYIGATFNADGRVTRIEDFDSISLQYYTVIDMQLKGDTIFLADDEMFVVDGNKRVKEYILKADPTDPQDFDLIMTYSYNAEGQLLSKIAREPITNTNYIEILYNWSGGNLSRIRFDIFGTNIYQADYEYHTDISVNNFMYVFADLFDSVFDLGLNLGKKPVNAVKKITISGVDPDDGQPFSGSTQFYNYKLSANKQVQSYVVENNILADFAIYAGKNQLRYKCF